MIKREQKLLFKQIESFTKASRSQKEKRALEFRRNTQKLKIPQEIYKGMRKKSLGRIEERKQQGQKFGFVGETGQRVRMMEEFFKAKEERKREAKRQRKYGLQIKPEIGLERDGALVLRN